MKSRFRAFALRRTTFDRAASYRRSLPWFASFILGAVVVSLVVLVVLLTTTITPQQARAERAVPNLPPPTIAVFGGSRPGVVAVPEGAISTNGLGDTKVRVWLGDTPRIVAVQRLELGSLHLRKSKLVEVLGTGLHVGDRVELVALEGAIALPPTGGGQSDGP